MLSAKWRPFRLGLNEITLIALDGQRVPPKICDAIWYNEINPYKSTDISMA